MAEDRNFLSRWSQRKLEKKHEEEAAEAVEPAAPAEGESAADLPPEPDDAAEREPHPAEAIDIDSLTKESDFTIFMQRGVPADVKRRALRKLWRSDPLLANLDGLNDYEDMVRVYGIGPIGATAWKIGRGFLTDDELGLNAKEKAEEDVPADAPEGEAEEVPVAAAEPSGTGAETPPPSADERDDEAAPAAGLPEEGPDEDETRRG